MDGFRVYIPSLTERLCIAGFSQMANLPYNFKGKPMEPYDKKPAREGGVLLFVGIAIVVLMLVAGGFVLWLVLRHPSKPSADLHVDEPQVHAPVELPPSKEAESQPQPLTAAPSVTKTTPPATAAPVASTPAPVKPVPSLIPPKQPNPQEAAKRLEAANKLFADEKYSACREECWRALELVNEDDALWTKATDLLGKTSIIIFTTDVRASDKVLYHVKAGDSLLKLALNNNTTMEAIRKSSGMASDDSVIRPGQTLAIYKGDWAIRVSKSRYRLYVYDGPRLFKVYPVGIGRQDRTPAGTFELGVKQPKPDWYNKGKKYEFGSPENILGTRWMALSPTGSTSQDLRGYGIHGTNDPANVGKSTSNGCVRMRNEDVDELYAITPMKTPVEIIE